MKMPFSTSDGFVSPPCAAEVASAPSPDAAPPAFKLEWCVRGNDGHVVITPLGGDTPTPPTQVAKDSLEIYFVICTHPPHTTQPTPDSTQWFDSP